MKKVDGNWTGRITGTNNANVFVEIKQDGSKLYGISRINDPQYGTSVYNFTGVIEENIVILSMVPDNKFINKQETQEVIINGRKMTITANMVRYGNVSVKAKLVNNSTIEGKWQSTIGTGGNLFLINEKEKSAAPQETSTTGKKNTVFISYSHEDQKHLKRLHVHIKPLEKKGLVDVWDDTKLIAGDKWREQITSALSKAAIAVLIISADFLASDFIVDNELPPILKKAELEGTLVLPVILKPCRFLREDTLSRFQALNPPDKPILSMPEVEQEIMWDKLSQRIEIELNRS
ncbi:toll/interleukin-1 receptor domain-containing protein [Desulfosudis oleivorans]|uniref:TIR domain-containing protein n=1 Tax=Desulfosudis oleivorans (strain DSM 6200 / JCM 39069 / Hxd3) TaxID=96561 RepID=A9A029_DESOH|nr:toll/interleukin-1 receptor domain-containing protein [Desulfosudis oleivorans]ABW67429.1 hypothetical protein Dole_1625 [Desulfosudis oleivorans Hxd3]